MQQQDRLSLADDNAIDCHVPDVDLLSIGALEQSPAVSRPAISGHVSLSRRIFLFEGRLTVAKKKPARIRAIPTRWKG